MDFLCAIISAARRVLLEEKHFEWNMTVELNGQKCSVETLQTIVDEFGEKAVQVFKDDFCC